MTAAKLTDVARAAGASVASVSRVLNHPDRVSPAMRRRVEAALASLDYVPNWAARGLASRRSRTVAAIVPTLDIAIFAKGVQALQARLEKAGYTLLVACSDYEPAKEAREVRAFIERGIDGLVMTGNWHEPDVAAMLEVNPLPRVHTYSYDKDSAGCCVGIDNRKAMQRLTRYLLDLGHRRFGVATSPMRDNDRVSARVAGVHDALAAAGVTFEVGQIAEVPHSIADGSIALRSLLDRDPRLTAIICINDTLAIGALAEARERGIAVPDTLSITGFDDLDLAAHMAPALTTVRCPASELCTLAAEQLLARIEGTPTVERVELKADLIVRRSTAVPAHPRSLATA